VDCDGDNVPEMAKKWLVYAFTFEDFEHGLAKQGLVEAIEPDSEDEVLLKVSERDCDQLDDWIAARGYRSDWVYRVRKGVVETPVWVEATADAGVPFEWEFDDAVDVVDRHPQPRLNDPTS